MEKDLISSVRPIREGLLLNTSQGLDHVRLAGSQCNNCGEVSLGSIPLCPNCGGDQMNQIALSDRGTLWTYTVARHKPPGDYRGPEPFEPFGVGLIELPEGVRVMSRIDGEIDKLRVGKMMIFTPSLRHESNGEDVVTFCFRFEKEVV